MRRKIGLIAVIIFVILIFISFVYSYWESLPSASYKIGDEIKGFPIDGTSMIITNFSTSPDLTFPDTSEDVIVNITLNNLSSYPVYFNQTDSQTNLSEASIKHLDLKYKTETGVGETSAWNYTDHWGITLYGIRKNEFNWLGTNESANGSIRFVLGDNTYSSFDMVCRSTSQQKPLFIVNLK